MNHHNGYSKDYRPATPKQRGVILLISLIVLVAMTLAGIALVRSVDTGTLTVGALLYRQSTVQTADIVVNRVMGYFATGKPLNPEPTADNSAYAYLANYNQANSTVPGNAEGDPAGVPTILLPRNDSIFAATYGSSTYGKVNTETNGEKTRFLVERMCDTNLAANASSNSNNCVLSNSIINSGPDDPNRPGGVSKVIYRLTVRVDGPKNTTSYVQVFFK